MFSRLPMADGHILTAANEWGSHSAECGEYAKRIWRANKKGACLCFEGKRLLSLLPVSGIYSAYRYFCSFFFNGCLCAVKVLALLFF